ncbi:transposase [Xanthomonas citri pv. citri]|nr:transposase [Xanthomonas citri pv. citri]
MQGIGSGQQSSPCGLRGVDKQTEHWLADYNQQIPHDSVGGLTPAEFRDQHQPQTSSFGWH